MADAIDKATDTSGRVDEADTSTNEDSFDTADFDETGETWDEDDTTDDDSTTDEPTDDEAATFEAEDSDEESSEDVESDDSPTDEESEPTEEAPAEPVDPAAEEQHRRNQEAAQRRIAEREKAKQDAQQQLLDSAEDTRDLALKQLQIDAYNNRVMQVTNQITADLNNAVTGIDLFQSKDPVIREAMLDAVDKFEQLHVRKDEFGDPVQVTGDLNAYLQQEAARIRKLTGIGAKQQEQAKQTQKKRTLAPPARTPAKPKVDPDLAAFDEAADRDW